MIDLSALSDLLFGGASIYLPIPEKPLAGWVAKARQSFIAIPMIGNRKDVIP
jgi:hypothetical protein